MSTPALDAPGVSVCVVDLADRTLAVEIGHAREAREFTELTTVPLAPPALIGLTNLRGTIIPILDLGLLLGLAARPRGRVTRTLVIEIAGVRLALVVDRVVGVELGPVAATPAPEDAATPAPEDAAAPALEDAAAPAPEDAAASASEDTALFQQRRLVRGDDAVAVLDVQKIRDLLGRWA